MSEKFMYTDTEMKIVENFQKIHGSMIIEPSRFTVMKPGASVLGFYKFDNDYEYEPYGIYNLGLFNQIIKLQKDCKLSIDTTLVRISDKSINSEFRIATTPIDSGMIEETVNPSKAFDNIDTILDFTFHSSKLSPLKKTGDIVQFEKIYLENANGKIRITGADNNKESTRNPYQIDINESEIEENDIPAKTVLSFKREEINLLLDDYDYRVEIKQGKSGKWISRWTNDVLKSLHYFVGLTEYKLDEDD